MHVVIELYALNLPHDDWTPTGSSLLPADAGFKQLSASGTASADTVGGGAILLYTMSGTNYYAQLVSAFIGWGWTHTTRHGCVHATGLPRESIH